MVVYELHSITQLVNNFGNCLCKQSLSQLNPWLIDQLKDILISGVLTNKVNIVPVIEEAIDLGNIRMVQEVVDLNLSEHIFNNIQFDHFPFFQDLYSTQETSSLVNSPINLTISSFA